MPAEIRIVYKRPGCLADVQFVENSLQGFRALLDGGHIEFIRLREYGQGIHGYADEEGRLKDLPYNLDVDGEPIVGPIFFSKGDGEGEDIGFEDVEEAFALCRFLNA
jgi:hypothetical protein